MAKNLEEWEIFYEEVGTNSDTAEVEYDDQYEEPAEPPGLNEEDVYKLSEDLEGQPTEFDEQIEPRDEE